jgi:hypothetical protein
MIGHPLPSSAANTAKVAPSFPIRLPSFLSLSSPCVVAGRGSTNTWNTVEWHSLLIPVYLPHELQLCYAGERGEEERELLTTSGVLATATGPSIRSYLTEKSGNERICTNTPLFLINRLSIKGKDKHLNLKGPSLQIIV